MAGELTSHELCDAVRERSGEAARAATSGAIAECRLDLAGARAQRDRYRSLAQDVTELSRNAGTLAVRFAESVDGKLLREAIEVERGCCPFFTFSWHKDERLLKIGTAEPQQEPALEGLAFALQAPGPAAESSPRA
jgi:hypothetical protein